MPAHGRLLTISANAPAPFIEVTIGQAQWGEYIIFLWDTQHHNPSQVGAGLNNDNLPDKFVIAPSALSLHGRRLSWQVGIAAPNQGPGQNYSLTVRITQSGQTVPGGLIQDTAPLINGSIFLRDFVQFQTQ